MFDAKSVLENIVRGAAPSGAGTSPQSGGGLGDILNDILKSTASASGSPSTGSAGGLGDILNQIGKSLSPSQLTPAGGAPTSSNPEFGNILTQLKDKLGQSGGAITDGGSIGDILGKVFTQATQGVKEGSSRLGEASGA
ncbi:MAG TPA: tellurite resistance TerB family protein, partial [Hyphomicrobium sp.]|nr:tellurite resistance TerB family protein [Hyphomicrobium sp.]